MAELGLGLISNAVDLHYFDKSFQFQTRFRIGSSSRIRISKYDVYSGFKL